MDATAPPRCVRTVVRTPHRRGTVDKRQAEDRRPESSCFKCFAQNIGVGSRAARGLASPDGGLTRRDLHNSLGCLGIKLTPWSCDNLFRALLEYAIEDGEVTLSYHIIHKALLHNFKGAECISALEKERREILDKMDHE